MSIDSLLTIVITQLCKGLDCRSVTGGVPGPPLSPPILDVIDFEFEN